MAADSKALAGLLYAASALAYARRQDMDTCEEWDDLERAVLAAEEAPPTDRSPRCEFRGATLMRFSTLASGAPEDHACDVDDIEQVGYAIEAKQGAVSITPLVPLCAMAEARPWAMKFSSRFISLPNSISR